MWIKSTSFNVWVRYFVWNFKGTLWNSTQNIIPIHWKIWFLCNFEILRALRFKSSYVFLKRPPGHIREPNFINIVTILKLADVIWWNTGELRYFIHCGLMSWPTLAQEMACCLIVPSHYMNQLHNVDFSLARFCGVQLRAIYRRMPWLLFCMVSLKKYTFEITAISLRGKCVNNLRVKCSHLLVPCGGRDIGSH